MCITPSNFALPHPSLSNPLAHQKRSQGNNLLKMLCKRCKSTGQLSRARDTNKYSFASAMVDNNNDDADDGSGACYRQNKCFAVTRSIRDLRMRAHRGAKSISVSSKNIAVTTSVSSSRSDAHYLVRRDAIPYLVAFSTIS